MTQRGLMLAATGVTLAYYAARAIWGESWVPELLYLVPPAVAMLLLLRRGAGAAGRVAAFWNLMAFGAGLWLAGQALWTLAVALGWTPRLTTDLLLGFPVPMDALFIGFLVPMVAAVALQPHPRPHRVEPVALVDVGLLAAGIAFLFLRLVVLPRAVPFTSSGIALAVLAFVLSVVAAGLCRVTDDAEWKRRYGLIAVFAIGYGAFSAVANGSGIEMPPPGGVIDLTWMVPFFALAATVLPGAWRPAAMPLSSILLVAGPGPLAMDLLLDAVLTPGTGGHASHLVPLLAVSALLVLGCVLRLWAEQVAAVHAAGQSRLRAEEEQRGARLATLAAVSASFIEDLRSAMEDVVTRAEAVAADLDERGGRVVAQAERARTIARELTGALRLARPGVRKEIDLALLLEETVESVVSEGLGLRVSLAGVVGLPAVAGDPGALRAAVLHLLRNAAQASPGGVLRIGAEASAGEVVVRFQDDGPGVPETLRERVFHPFFTTRRVGDGVGLGLTFVHFVAREHGGSVLLEPTGGGACFTLRLPVATRHAEATGQTQWPLAAAALAAGAIATVLAVLPTPRLQATASGLFELGAALVATLALAWTAVRSARRERTFWALLAAGPALWSMARLVQPLSGPPHDPIATGGGLAFFIAAAADLCWVAALLVRPDRAPGAAPTRLSVVGCLAAFALAVHLSVYLLVLPAPFAGADAVVRLQIVIARIMQRSVLAGWVAVLCSRAVPAYWRDTYRRLAIAFAVWALGHSLAGRALSFSDYRAGGLTDLGWIVPFLLLAALAIERRPEQVAFEGAAVSPYPLRTAASLAALAAVPAFDALFAFSGHPALDLGRERLTRVTVFVVGLLLAAREVLAHREAAVTRVLLRGARNQLESAARRNRMLGVVGSAVHELAGVLSGVRSLLRLILSQPDLPQRARAESERAQQGTSAAAGIVRNLTALVRRTPDTLTLVSLNDLVRHVVEARRADLAQEGIELQLRLASELPSLPVDGPALQQVLGGLIDNGAVAIRSAGRRGVVEVSTHGQDGRVLLRVADDGPGLSEAARRSLAEALTLEDANWSGSGMGLRIAREVVALHGGTLSGRNRVGGGAELEILLPLVVGRQEEQTG